MGSSDPGSIQHAAKERNFSELVGCLLRSWQLKTCNLDFPIKNPFVLLCVYKLTDQVNYWIKYKADFILYPLSERERSPNKLVPLIEIDPVLYYATLLHQTCNMMMS